MIHRIVAETVSLFGPLFATSLVLGVYLAREIRRDARESRRAVEQPTRTAA